jgi:hypothetical protein
MGARVAASGRTSYGLAVDGHRGQPGALAVAGAGPQCLGPLGAHALQLSGVDLGQRAAQGGLTGCGDRAGQRVGFGAQRPQHPHGGVRGPLGLRGHLVMSGARCRSNHYGQQEPQLVAQALPRPVINYLIQVLDERAISATNSRELPTGVCAGVLGVVLGDELLAGSGWDRAGWRHGHGPSRRSAA